MPHALRGQESRTDEVTYLLGRLQKATPDLEPIQRVLRQWQGSPDGGRAAVFSIAAPGLGD